MTTDPLEKFEPKEQRKARTPSTPLPSPVNTPAHYVSPEPVEDFAEPSGQPLEPRTRLQFPRVSFHGPSDVRVLGFAAAFVVGAAAALFLLSAVAFSFSSSYQDRVLPGVHTGAVDLSGLTRDEAIARLQSEYAYLSQGEVTVTTPVGVASITYQQAGRKPDVEAMADAAMAVGHSGNPLADAASVVHSAAFGANIPVIIEVDPTALAQRIHQLVGTSSLEPQDAQATAKGGNFSFTPSASGRGIDEKTIGSTIIDQLTSTSAPADLQAGGTFVTLSPQISDADAQSAIALAQKMIADVKLTWSTPPAGAPATWKAQSWTITAAQIRSWIVFGTRPDGTYGPAVDPAQVGTYLATISAKVSIAPTEPKVGWDSSGKPISLTQGKDGVGIDPVATASAVSAYLDALAAGNATTSSIEVVTGAIHPQIADLTNVAGMVVVGKWTTTFYPDISNGMGKNIRQPAANLNGQVIGPGQQFSFLAGVGPIDPAHGFTMGGVIVDGKSNHTGAMGGGICSASTTMFNAAATAGLQIDERHAHFYYINRYPIGRDATVYSNGQTTWDLRWTNDTPYPIVIRAWTTYGSRSTITFQLWTLPLNRTVTWSGGTPVNKVTATNNKPEYVSTLKPGQTNIAEYATNGFDTSVTRVVTDATGAVLHKNTWASHYTVVNGQVQIGGSPPPSQTPTPTPGAPTPTPAPSALPPTPAPTPTPTRRRKVVA
ncbi:MAG: VanW family protein [Candidatus Limnocylindrales bacterium]|jgi:vancomycin resistance protein YoaR